MPKPECLYGIIDNKIIEFEVIKELDYHYNCIYYFNNEWHNIGIPKDKIHKEYFLTYKRCEKKLKEINKNEKKITS